MAGRGVRGADSGPGSTPRNCWTRSGSGPRRRPNSCGPASRASWLIHPRTSRSARTRTSSCCAGCRRCHSAQRTRLVTTDGEFHTLRRQLDRLAEEGVEVTKIAAHPADTLAERVASAVDDRTLAVLMSSVLFETCGDRAGTRSRRGRVCDTRRRAADRCLPPPERRAVRSVVDGTARRIRHGRRLQVLPARRGQLLPARAGWLPAASRSSPDGSPSSKRSNRRAA